MLTSVLTCGCCRAPEYDLKPHAKKCATATLVTVCLMLIHHIIATVILVAALAKATSSLETANLIHFTMPGTLPIIIIHTVLVALALVFIGLFTWGHKCGALSALGETPAMHYEMLSNLM